MFLLLHLNGEQFQFIVFDCGPLNHCAIVAGALMMLLVDLGLVEFSMAIFFWQNVRAAADTHR